MAACWMEVQAGLIRVWAGLSRSAPSGYWASHQPAAGGIPPVQVDAKTEFQDQNTFQATALCMVEQHCCLPRRRSALPWCKLKLDSLDEDSAWSVAIAWQSSDCWVFLRWPGGKPVCLTVNGPTFPPVISPGSMGSGRSA